MQAVLDVILGLHVGGAWLHGTCCTSCCNHSLWPVIWNMMCLYVFNAGLSLLLIAQKLSRQSCWCEMQWAVKMGWLTKQETSKAQHVSAMQGVLLALHGAAASRGWRINLRPLAEVQTLAWTPIFLFAFWISWHMMLVMWRVLTEPYDNNEHAVQPLQTHRQNVHRMPATTHAHSRLHQIPHAMQDRV